MLRRETSMLFKSHAMIAIFKIFFARYKSFLAAALLESSIIIIYLLFCQTWFFDGEDYGIIFRAAHASGLQDYVDFFILNLF